MRKHTYNSYGGCRTCSVIGDFLEMNCPDFGSAIKEIEIHIHFPSKPGTKAKRTLEGLYEDFHQGLMKLPECKFLRKKNRFIIKFESEAGYANDPHVEGYGDPDLGLYQVVFKEIVSQLKILKTRIKPTDNFQLDAFFSWLDEQLETIPQTEKELLTLKTQSQAYSKAKRESMDEWEKLGVDWVDYHSSARDILDEPFYWDFVDDFAPHGNDSGADLLHAYEEWRKTNKSISSKTFFRELWQSWWGSEVSLEDVTTQHPDDYAISDYDKLTVALAFAHLKHEARCPKWIGQKAIESINRRCHFVTKEHPDWEYLEEYITKANKMEKILEKYSA